MPEKFTAQPGDLRWGSYDYPVTRTQKKSLDGILWMFSTLPPSRIAGHTLPEGAFCSQNPKTGSVYIGLHHRSVSVHRTGRITANRD